MEKMGIFNILSALSNFKSQNPTNAEPKSTTQNDQLNQNPKQNTDQKASLTPKQTPPSTEPPAIFKYISRHDEISRRIDEKNKLDKK